MSTSNFPSYSFLFALIPLKNVIILFFLNFSLDALGSFQQLQICESLPPCAWAYTHHQLAQRLHTTSVSCISRHENVHVRKGRLIATDAQLFISLCVAQGSLKIQIIARFFFG